MKNRFVMLVIALCSAFMLTSCVYSYDAPDRGPQHRPPPPGQVKPEPAPRPPAHKPAPKPAPKHWRDDGHR